MKETTNPISLSKIRLSAYEASDKLASTLPGYELFDDRHDFIINTNVSGLAVLVILANERCFDINTARGIRRHIKVVLIDETANMVLDAKRVWADLHSFDIDGKYRVDFPISYADINLDHTYRVIVKDECSHVVLGYESFRFYDESRYGKAATGWFSVKKGCIRTLYDDKYKAIECIEDIYYKLHFDLGLSFMDCPVILPELEVRVYSPKGVVSGRFARPSADKYEPDEYELEVPFFASIYDKGVYYIELLCMDYAIAGMVVSTDYTAHGGEWEQEDLAVLDEYSLDEATRRFHAAMGVEDSPCADGDSEDEDESADDDVFERLLNEFISSPDDDSEDDETLNDADREEDGDEECDNADDEAAVPEPEAVQPVSALRALDSLTGLKSVKEKLASYEKLMLFNKMRIDKGLPTLSTPLHAMFMGAPGTGKTTVAKRMGLMMRRSGVLSRGHVVVKERANLIGPNYSNEETNTLKAIEEAQGGILFIDEAYQLFQPNDPRDPGRFVIETLMTALADESKRDWMLILAGYPDEMTRMFEMNPGLRSRIPDSNIYVFDDFTEHELMEIAVKYLDRNGFSLSAEAHHALAVRLGDDYRNRDKSFGNARHVINMIQTEILPAMAARVVSSPDIDVSGLSIVQPCDIPCGFKITKKQNARIGYCA